ncbi:leucine zipper putative tumor suppressor 1 [Scleropages formosus]|uniref:Leucine zipper putative tumor suppressor 1 n=1 Tax=Scleropages formosus TaxID=113540 RepID=A0A0P7UAG6_SCLFO|nr:leucine zipper putative tumor suppressor 1 [Scleropages formosus]XP_018599666.1 leucine zipper putative tumor suppressor 1 [Scleropages formosus]KPP67254.1 leucine zipper putative tumor suppressor 1 [Scleropages formosus]
MGSVSSLITGHSLHSKHCRATEYKLKRGPQPKRTGRNLDGLLRHGFCHEPAGDPGKAGFRPGRSEDFFYIKVSHKPRTPQQRQPHVEDNAEDPTDMETGSGTPPQLVPMSGKLEKGIEKSLIRPTAFKPVIPRSSSTTDSRSLSQGVNKGLSPTDRGKEPSEQRLDANSGTLSDSGRNSMSSLPTHSTNGSAQTDNFSTTVGALARCGGSAHSAGPTQNPSCVAGGNMGSAGSSSKLNPSGDGARTQPASEGTSPERRNLFPECKGGCMRSPISMDESLIELLEQRLLERENELQELQVSFEEKEADTCKLFQDKQRHCAEEMEGLKQRCSSQLRQASQKALRAQQLLQLQVFQLQQDKKKLQDDLAQLSKEKDQMEVKLRSYETKQTQLAPTLEETQWEVCQKSGEISLLKQQLKDSQADVSHKLSEIVSLKATLKETKIKMEALEQKIKEQEEAVRSKAVEVEVCENELQRKKNEADLLRGKVIQLETDIRIMRQDLVLAKELGSARQVQERESVKGQPEGGEDTEALQRALEKLKEELKEERKQKEDMVSSFQLERQTWDREKDKVIRYQKQLQYNYLQMHRKNQDLEKLLRELTAELESRPEVDLDVQSADIHFEDIIATEI